MSDPLIDLPGLKVGAEDFLGAVLDTVAQPIWVVDPDGVIRFANPAAIAALGYDTADELYGRHSHEAIHYNHPDGTPYPAADCPMLLPRSTGETVASDLDWFFRRDGSMFPVSYVSVPIEMPEGRGAVVAFADIEDRLRAEQELHERDAVLSAREDSLRRIAALVAGGAASEDVFAAIAREVGHVVGLPLVVVWRYAPGGTTATVIGAWSEVAHPFQPGTRWALDGPAVLTQVLQTGRPARIDDLTEVPGTVAAAARETGLRAAAGAPIIVDGSVWGAMTGNAGHALAADHMEDRLAAFTELVATAISNTESRAGVTRLAADQAALRRVATLVARAVPPEDVFAAVVEEIGRLLPVDFADLGRCEPDGTITFLAAWGKTRAVFPIGARLRLGGKNATTLVAQTGGPVRVESYADASGEIGGPTSETGVRSAVGTPITVAGRLWGVMAAGWSLEEPMPADTEQRLAQFTDLLETAIANADARTEVARLADEQAALRRVATLVAEGAAPAEVFQTVTREVGILCGADLARMERYEPDQTVIGVAGWSRGDVPELAVGTRFSLEGASIAAMVHEASRPVRVDSFAGARGPIAQEARDLGIQSSVGCPIVVDGRLWGVIAASSKSATPFPADTESQIGEFTELVATAIANTEARTQVGQLADEQAALRRVATLVARGTPAAEVFSAVSEELERLFDTHAATIGRLEPDGAVTIVASCGSGRMPLGGRLRPDSASVLTKVVRTGRAARVDDYSQASGILREVTQRSGIRCSVAVPIMVEGSLWGSIAVGTVRQQFPADTEQRMAEFTELVATAIANIQAREDLAASRARIVAAADDERRRLVRDLHDGAQQRLVHTVITLKLAHRALQNEGTDLAALLTDALDHAAHATDELRELSHGILPAVLTRGGLRAGVDALASRMRVPVENAVSVGRLPGAVEATAYFVVAEALTNIAKHAHAGRASVTARVEDGTLQVQVRDDGVGGARPDGSGLVGLRDRLAVLDGRLRVESPADGGTLVAADIPLSG